MNSGPRVTRSSHCVLCHRPMCARTDKPAPGERKYGGRDMCVNCYSTEPTRLERLTGLERDRPELDVETVRAALDAYIADRRARGIPWCGTAPDPQTFSEERAHPGMHKWLEPAA